MSTGSSLRLNVTAVGVVLVMALGALTAFAYLGSRSLWFDEITGATVACLEKEEYVLAAYEMDSHPPGTALLEHWSRRAFGINEWALRLPSALAATLMIGVIAALGGLWGNIRVGWLAAVLAALSPTYVLYAQNARPYALGALWVAAATACFFAAWRGGRPWFWWPLYAASAAAAFYTHYFTTMVIAAHFAVVALGFFPRLRPPGHESLKRYIPQVMFFVLAVAAAAGVTADVFVKAALDRERFPGSVMSLTPSLFWGALGHVGWDRAVANALFFLAVINGVVFLGHRQDRFTAVGAAALTVIPVFLPLITIRLTTQYWNPRFSYFGFPAVVVVAAYGFVALARNLWGGRGVGARAATAVLIAGAVKACCDDWVALRVQHKVENQDFRGAVAFCNRNRDWQTTVLVWPYRNVNCCKFYTQTQGGPEPLYESREEVERIFASRARVFFISTDDEYDDALQRKFPTTVRLRLARVNVLYHDLEINDAEEVYRKVPSALLGAPPGSVDTALGRWAAEKGDVDRAITFCARGVRDGPVENSEVVRLADMYAARGYYSQALSLIGGYIRRHPDEPWPYTKIANVYWEKGDANSAIYYYRRAVWLAPDRDDWRERLRTMVASRRGGGAWWAWSDPRWL